MEDVREKIISLMQSNILLTLVSLWMWKVKVVLSRGQTIEMEMLLLKEIRPGFVHHGVESQLP